MPVNIPKNLSIFLQETVSRFSERVALKIKRDGRYEAFTYQDLYEKTQQMAQGLHELGVTKGSRVAILAENSPEWVIAYFAIVTLGAVAVPVDPKLSESEWMMLFQHCEPSVIFSASSMAGLLLKNQVNLPFVKGFIQLDGADKDIIKKRFFFKDLLKQKIDFPSDSVQSGDLAVIVYTSGTTGNPKGVMLSHGNILYYPCVAASDDSIVVKNGRILLLLPLHHVYPANVLLTGLATGAAFTLLLDFKLSEIIAALHENKITGIPGVPRLYEFLHKGILEKVTEQTGFSLEFVQKIRRVSRLSQRIFGMGISKILFWRVHQQFGGCINNLTCGGAFLRRDVFEFFRDLGFLIQEGYGLTETSGCVVMNSRNRIKTGSAGIVLPGCRLQIEQPQSDGVGEILVSGSGIFQGYFKNNEITSGVLQNGWFHTGDLGRLDQDGYLFITGRKKDVIVLPSGKNVYPDEVEMLYAHRDLIKQIGVICMDRGRGEEVFACIVPNSIRSKAGDELSKQNVEIQIKEHLADISKTVSPHKRISGYQFLYEKIPVTSLNKIKRHELKNMITKIQPDANQQAVKDENSGTAKQKILNMIRDYFEDNSKPIVQLHLELDLGMDSLSKTELWAAIERELEIRIPDETKISLKDTRQIIDFLRNQKNLSAKTFSFLDESDQDETDWKSLLDETPEETRKRVADVLDACPRARITFLKIFFRIFRRISRLKAKGLENIPKTGPFILAPNHESHLDNLFVACFLPSEIQKNMAVMGKREHFDSLLTRWLIKLCNGIAVDRENVSVSVLQTGVQFLKEGKILLIHPEGTRSPDGSLLPFKNGVGLLAVHQQCPVVPVYIEGAHEFWPKDAVFPKRRGDISVSIGQPLYPEPLPSGQTILELAGIFTAKLKESVENLKGIVD